MQGFSCCIDHGIHDAKRQLVGLEGRELLRLVVLCVLAVFHQALDTEVAGEVLELLGERLFLGRHCGAGKVEAPQRRLTATEPRRPRGTALAARRP